MKSSLDSIVKSLTFRTITPIITIALLAWAGLYLFVLRSVSHFADEQIREAFVEMAHDIHTICYRKFSELVSSGSYSDEQAAQLHQTATLGMIDRFMEQNRLQGAVVYQGSYLLLTKATGEDLMKASQDSPGIDTVFSFSHQGHSYYTYHMNFEPWEWNITLIKDSVEYSSLMQNVQTAYGVTGIILSIATFGFIYSLRKNIRIPLNQILNSIKQGLKPDYHGIAEFEYLSDSVRTAMLMHEKETLMLNNLYHIAAVKRGEDFFDEVTMAISRLFQLHAGIARLNPGGSSEHVISLYLKGEIRKNFDMELEGTPCEEVVAKRHISVITSGVCRQFPDAGVLVEAGAESFIGFAIFSRKGDVIGVINAFGNERDFSESDIKVLQTIGEMVASEFERLDEENEKEKMREQLFQAHKMEAIGTLAGGIAHDFNNMLQGILGHASLIKTQIPQDHVLFDSVDTIEHIADRAAQLTMQLLGFARKGKYVVRQIDINDVVRNVLKIIAKTFDRKIEIRTALGQDTFALEGDRSQIEQVIMNLCLNARDAMPHGGTLTIETFNRTAVSQGLPPTVHDNHGQQVVVRISDTGIGMSDDVKDHIFEPFFTTKEMGKGTGMGLAMVYGVITNHDGSVTVDSVVGKGTTFTVSFPAVMPEKTASERPSTAVVHGKGTILVADDEEYIREILQNMLGKLGYKTLLVANGKEAVEMYAREMEHIDLVILDLIMPVMSGQEAYERLIRLNSKVKVLIASGHITEDQSPFPGMQNRHDFIQKPFTLQEIAARIQSLLSV